MACFRTSLMRVRFRPAKFAITALCCAATGAWATQYGNVVSSTPVFASVPVAQRECVDESVVYQHAGSGAGALVGAIAGAAVGNAFGHGGGRALATGIGMVTGAAIGDRVEANGSPPVASTVQRCRNVTTYQNHTVGYDVVYDYQGVRRSVRVAQDPGSQIALDVNVVPHGEVSPGRVVVVPPPPAYRAPVDVPYYDEVPPPRVIYVPPPVYVNPWPYAVAGAWYGGGWRGGRSEHEGEGYGHRH
jgi:uncharacterized protein YcfJ